mmetsp:Transcript_11353/g.33436  ORF Transcript_11353/g.33436 Transcript_11353/m.33436 type:complete len:94 (-) Transcript_11353:157-438(-)
MNFYSLLKEAVLASFELTESIRNQDIALYEVPTSSDSVILPMSCSTSLPILSANSYITMQQQFLAACAQEAPVMVRVAPSTISKSFPSSTSIT